MFIHIVKYLFSLDGYSGHPRPLIYGKKSRFKNRQWYDTLSSVHSGCPGSLWRPIQLGRESWKKMRWCQQCMADHSRFGPCPSIPISQSPRAHLFERFWRTLSTCSRHCKVLLEGSGEIMRLSVLIIEERATLLHTHYSFLLVIYMVPHHVFFFSGSHQSTGAQLGGRSIPISADTSGHGAWGGAQKFGKGRNVLCKVVNLKVSNSTSWMCAFIILDEDDDTSRLYCNLLYEFKNVS